MQAFLYRHLVPAQELTLTSDRDPAPVSFEMRRSSNNIVELPLGTKVRLPLKGFVHTARQGTQVSLDQPPDGITVIRDGSVAEKATDRKNLQPQATSLSRRSPAQTGR